MMAKTMLLMLVRSITKKRDFIASFSDARPQIAWKTRFSRCNSNSSRGDPRGISPGGTPGKIVFLIPPFPGENFPIPRGKLNKKLPEKVIFFYVISLFFTFCYIFGHLWFQICLIATLYLSSGEYFHTLKVFADNEKFDQISDGEKWIEKL